jgi:hypothetical protein
VAERGVAERGVAERDVHARGVLLGCRLVLLDVWRLHVTVR